jgi:hypothetical protein
MRRCIDHKSKRLQLLMDAHKGALKLIQLQVSCLGSCSFFKRRNESLLGGSSEFLALWYAAAIKVYAISILKL